MSQLKIIFSGPVGAGKTTAIGSISDIPPIKTEANATESFYTKKSHTTVAMDYGVLNLDDGTTIHLYGTPGQKRFDFMWEILQQGGVGLILLINSASPEVFSDIHEFLTTFRSFIDETALVIGVTHMDRKTAQPLETIISHMEKLRFSAPVFEVDPREKSDIAMLVEALIYSIIPDLET